VGALQEVLLIRGLLSPVGHAAWTGPWSARYSGGTGKGRKFNDPDRFRHIRRSRGLHWVWDMPALPASYIYSYLGYAGIGVVSLTLLVLRLRDARKYEGEAITKDGVKHAGNTASEAKIFQLKQGVIERLLSRSLLIFKP